MEVCFLPSLYHPLALDYMCIAWNGFVHSLSCFVMCDKVIAQRLSLATSVLTEGLESRVLASEEKNIEGKLCRARCEWNGYALCDVSGAAFCKMLRGSIQADKRGLSNSVRCVLPT